jgi:hypothetical protein
MALFQIKNNSIFTNLVKHNNFSEEIKRELYHLWCGFFLTTILIYQKTP